MENIESMNILKFTVFEIIVILFVSVLTSIISIFGLNHIDPKFSAVDNVGLRLIFSAISIVFTIGIISLILLITKQFPVSSKMALVFALLMGIYLETYRILADKYEVSNGTFWLPIIYSILIPSTLGAVFFLKIKF